jgi:hypothetical protein
MHYYIFLNVIEVKNDVHQYLKLNKIFIQIKHNNHFKFMYSLTKYFKKSFLIFSFVSDRNHSLLNK